LYGIWRVFTPEQSVESSLSSKVLIRW
jgi:hypothetical protein